MWYAEERLGERIRGAYAWASYLRAGGRIALGSDFPVESPDPLKGFYAAVSRRAEDGTSPHGSGGWYSEEKLSRVEALRGFTVDREWRGYEGQRLIMF
jgi:predicted amidohydrolase YtcJ